MRYKSKRRRRKQAALAKYMKRTCVIMLQEAHGSVALPRTWVDTQPRPCASSSSLSSRTTTAATRRPGAASPR
eukprot:983340-Pyramimonas_sp.AAC.1